jgi:phospholipid N-methyltransferase
MKSFFKEALGTIKTSGSVRPSSKYLIRDCIKDIDFSTAEMMVELGPGDGCITAAILGKMNPTAQLHSFEINGAFIACCESKFSEVKNFHLHHASALDMGEIMDMKEIATVDHIVSSLPLTLFKEKDILDLLVMVKKYLKTGGSFIQYQYSLGKYNQLKEYFSEVDLDITLLNVPPAFVYRCMN